MRLSDLARGLFEQICQLPTVDAHEHLHAEELRLQRPVDIFLLFHQYLCTALISAGMDPQDAEGLGDPEVPLDRKWATLAPWLERVRACGVARPPFEALQFYFDETDLTASNYESLSARMQAHNVPGLYERCLRESCNLVMVLNQNRTMWQNELFRPILPEEFFIGSGTLDSLQPLLAESGHELPATVDELAQLAEQLLARRQAEGMIGVKGMCFPYLPGDTAEAGRAYDRLRNRQPATGDPQILSATLRDRLYDACGRRGLVVVKHSGVWSGGWSDHTNIRPTHLIPVALAHRETRFDLFHAGTPCPADAGLMARSLPNVWLNLCWSHLLSPVQSRQALDLWLDLAPANRVIAFGGDYWWAVENVYGALTQAREIVATVLAERVSSGQLDSGQALRLARAWLHDNPREVYGV